MDSAGVKVPYATIELSKGKKSFFTDSSGAFNLPFSDFEITDSITVSAIGFIKAAIPIKDIQGIIVLKRQMKALPEVLVYSGKWKKENWGAKSKPEFLSKEYPSAWGLPGPGSQIGRAIINENKAKPVWVYKVLFYFTHANNAMSPVRLRLYKMDEKGLPGNDLLEESIVKIIDSDKGWLAFNLEGQEIKMPPEGLIVAVEYFDTDAKNWNSEKVTYINEKGRKEKAEYKWYGGDFSTNCETAQGVSLMRLDGKWETLNNNTGACNNLVVQVWVKYPGK